MAKEPNYILGLRDLAMPADEIDRVFEEIKALTPGLAVAKPEGADRPRSVSHLIAANGTATLHIPSDAVESVKSQLGERFVLEPNPMLRHS